jgi:sulfur-oxidizing protein SoxY
MKPDKSRGVRLHSLSPEGRGSDRRRILAAGIGLGAWVLTRPAMASDELDTAIRAFAGGAPVRPGKVKLDVAPLVENGNTVPITVSVDSPMTPDAYVKAIAVFNERNPQREVATFHLGPRAGRATVSTRIRLATSQQLVAVARLADDSFWSHSVDVIVTLAGCVEA